MSTRAELGDGRRVAEKAWMLASSAAMSMKAGQGVCALLGRSSCGTCAGCGSPRCALRGGDSPPAARAAEFVQGCVAPLCTGGAVPLLPHEMRGCELNMRCMWAQRVIQVAERCDDAACSEAIRVKESANIHREATDVHHWTADPMSSHRNRCRQHGRGARYGENQGREIDCAIHA